MEEKRTLDLLDKKVDAGEIKKINERHSFNRFIYRFRR